MSSDSSDRNPVEELAEEFVERRRRGEHVSIEEYAERFPRWSADIRNLFPTLVVMERLGVESLEDEAGNTDPLPMLERIGDYRILREVGRGGMGIVYEAEQESLGRRVAVKVMLPSALMDARQVARFEREARAAAGLHHTNIVPIFGVGQQDGTHYFVMQLIDGQGLDNVLSELRRLRQPGGATDTAELSRLLSGSVGGGHVDAGSTSREMSIGERPRNPISSASNSATEYYRTAARLIVQAADALHYANAQGVLHRDLKPANLLLDAAGTLWITDFGLAKSSDSDDLTNTGDIVGTLRYMAPERFENECTAQSDIYGLGLTLYELVTLRPAYDEADRATLVAQIIHDSPPSPRKIAIDLPRDLETILLKAVSHSPNSRYSTAGEFAADLRRFLDGRPIQARRIGPIERTWRWCRRNPAVASLTFGIIISLLAVSVAYYNTRQALAEASTARSGETQALAQAEQRASDAEAAEKLAAEAVDQYFTTISESRLIAVPGLQPLRRELLTLALSYYEKLAERSGRRPELKRELAFAHERVASINAWIGSNDEAVSRYRAAIEIIDELRRDAPDDRLLVMQGARCHRRLGLELRDSSLLAESEAHLNLAIELYATVDAADQDSLYIVELARTLGHRGITRSNRQKLKEAIADCERAVEILQAVARSSPQIERALAEAFNMLGNVHADEHLGNFANALEPFAHVVQYYREVVEANPRQTYGRRELARALHNLGRAKFAAQDVQGSVALFREALDMRRELYNENPSVGTYQSDVIGSHDRLGRVYGRIEEPDRAVDEFRAAIDLQTDLVRQHPEVHSYKRQLANLWYALGSQHARAQRQEESNKAFEKAVELAEEVLATLDASAENHRFVAEISNNMGGLFRGQGQHDKARVQFQRAVSAAEEISRVHGESSDTLHLIGTYKTNLGNLESELQNVSAALAAFDEAIPMFEKILVKEPKHGRARMDLYNAYRSRAVVLTKAQRHVEAVVNWEQAAKVAPIEHTTYVTQCQGMAMARAGMHEGAGEAAERLLVGDSLRFYYKLPQGPALLKHLAATILATASQTALDDPSIGEEERQRFSDQHAARAVELLGEAAQDDLYGAPARLDELRTHPDFDPLRERPGFKQLLVLVGGS